MERATLNVEEIAEALDMSVSMVYRELNRGTIPSHKLGARYVVPKAMFERWLAGEPVHTAGGAVRRAAA